MLHSHDQAQWPEAGGGGQTDWRCRAFTALLRSPLLPPPAMASVVCGEATLPAYTASSGLNYCSGASAPLLCAALYGPGAYAAAPRTGACVRAPATPTQLPCPPGYAPACGSASCICAPLQSGGGGSLLPGQNASQGTAAASISALQASPGAPCATPLACFFAQSLPYALGALGALALALLLALYCLRRCLCPRSSFPLCCLRWRCARAAGRACGCGRCCRGGGGGGGRAGTAGGAGRSARLRAAAPAPAPAPAPAARPSCCSAAYSRARGCCRGGARAPPGAAGGALLGSAAAGAACGAVLGPSPARLLSERPLLIA